MTLIGRGSIGAFGFSRSASPLSDAIWEEILIPLNVHPKFREKNMDANIGEIANQLALLEKSSFLEVYYRKILKGPSKNYVTPISVIFDPLPSM